jgi:16S rRNA (adenine1518-N6/adenine1519-N6)-dimethyltransferase
MTLGRDVFDPSVIQSLCRQYQIEPKRERGQHFLVNRNIQAKIIQVAALDPQATVLEIGPGLGSLTEGLIRSCGQVIAVELDRRLARFLGWRFKGESKLRVIQDDIRTVNLPELGLRDRAYDLVSNLPYQITSLVLRNFLSLLPRPRRITLVIQREVAERLIAPKGKKSLLAISVEYFSTVRLHTLIPATAFWPKPEIESALITLDPLASRDGLDESEFFRVVRAGFSSRRKQLHNSLAAGLQLDQMEILKNLEKSSINPKTRAQDLALEDWMRLTRVLFDRAL